MINDLFKAGRVVESQNLMWKIAAEQIGGANATAADTLSGSYGRLTNQSTQLLEVWGRDIAQLLNLRQQLDLLASGMDRVAQKGKQGSSLGSFLQAAATLASIPVNPAGPALLAGRYMNAGAQNAAQDMGAFAQAARAAGDYGSALDALAIKRERLARARDLAAAASRDPFDAHAIEARRLRVPLGRSETLAHFVGGFGLLTTVDATGVSQRVIRRWPDDRLGHPIQPRRAAA